MNSHKLLEPQQLQSLIKSETPPVIVDFSSAENHSKVTISSSVNIPVSALLNGEAPFPNKLPAIEKINALLQQIHYHPTQLIVALDDEGGGWAGRFLWTLDCLGHDNWAYLNGGLHAWANSSYSNNEQSILSSKAQLPFTPATLQHVGITTDYIIENLDNPNIQFWDARSEREYSGKRSNSKRTGRIPGAIHCEWTSLMDTERDLRIRNDADSYLQSLGFDKTKTQITYCQSHHRSGFTWLVGMLLGYEVKAYDGSWNEWGNLDYTPIECD